MNKKFTLYVLLGTIFSLLLSIVGCVNTATPMESPVSPLPTANQTATSTAAQAQDAWATDTPDPSVSPLIISSVIRDENGVEIIRITNISNTKQELKHKTLLDPETMNHVDLPPDIALVPGDSFKVYNGKMSIESSNELVWLSEPLLQNKGDHLVLLNEAGRVLWNYVNLQDYP